MNKSRIFIIIGIVAQCVSILLFFLFVKPITAMSLICLCFILLAELEFFGGMAVIRQGAQENLSSAMRYGFSIVSGVYTAFSLSLSFKFFRLGSEMIKVFAFLQAILLIAALVLDLLIVLAARICRARKR